MIKIKKILLAFLFLSSFIGEVNSQIGNYCFDDFMQEICYNFTANNRFTSLNYSCTAITEGQGKYEIIDDKIRFTYEPMPFFTNQFTIKKLEEKKEKVEIEFSVKDYDSDENIVEYKVEYGIKIWHREKINHDKNQVNINFEGNPIFINVSYLDYSDYTFRITEGGRYKVNLFLRYGKSERDYEMKEGVEEYKIKEMVENRIILEKYNYEMIFIKEE